MFEITIMLITSLSILLIVYHHLGYPLLLRLLGRRQPVPAPIDMVQQQSLPTVTIVIPAFNEENFIADKIRNLSILDYPAGKLKIIIVSDGSTDRTYELALQTLYEPECRDLSIKVVSLKHNTGKVGVLNKVIQRIRTDLIALTDVSALVSMDALKQAVHYFNDPEIGVVNGNYQLLSPGSEGERQYWRYQSSVKQDEARLGSVIGSHGAFYLLRTHLFQTLPADTINDDFMIPMQIVRQGYRSALNPSINAIELERAGELQDKHRRRRISAGNIQQAIRLAGLLFPRFGGTAFTFASGKFLRVFVPYLMIMAFCGSWLLAGQHPVFKLLAVGQTLLYLQHFLLELLRPWQPTRLLHALNYLIRGHISGFKGSFQYLATQLLRQITGKTDKTSNPHEY